MGVDDEEWEEEQKRLDREWYGLDDGFDAEVSEGVFGNVSEEYAQKKEEQLEQKKRKRVTAKQKQIQKDNELWERNRMLTSGVVTSIDVDEDYEEEAEARVHLLVHNIVPPFLDGRYVFTKQPEAVVPVRVRSASFHSLYFIQLIFPHSFRIQRPIWRWLLGKALLLSGNTVSKRSGGKRRRNTGSWPAPRSETSWESKHVRKRCVVTF